MKVNWSIAFVVTWLLVAVAFIALQLTGAVDLNWWLVLAPLWVPVGMWLTMALVVGIIYGTDP